MNRQCGDKAETVRHMVLLIERHMLQAQQQIRDSRRTLEMIRDIIGYHEPSVVIDRMEIGERVTGDVVAHCREFLHHQIIGLRDPLEVLIELRGPRNANEPPVYPVAGD